MIKDLIKLPVQVVCLETGYAVHDEDLKMWIAVGDKDLAEALCTLINAHNADVGKLAEEYAYKMYPKVDDHANVRMRQALRESLIDAVLYGSTLNSGANDTQPAPLRPLRELAEDKEMCEEIARLCNPEKKEVFAVSSGNKFVKLVMEDYDLIVYENGQLEYADDFGNQTPDNTFAICALISSKYKIGE